MSRLSVREKGRRKLEEMHKHKNKGMEMDGETKA